MSLPFVSGRWGRGGAFAAGPAAPAADVGDGEDAGIINPDELLHWWRFDETEGDTYADSQVADVTLTGSAGAAGTTDNQPNQVGVLGAITGYADHRAVELTNTEATTSYYEKLQSTADITLENDRFTFSWWAKNTSTMSNPDTLYDPHATTEMFVLATSVGPNAADSTICLRIGPNTNDHMAFFLRTDADGGTVADLAVNNYDDPWLAADNGGLFPAGHDLRDWHHYALVYADGSNLKIYTNGVLRHTQEVSGALENATDATLTLGHNISGAGHNFLSLLYDDVRIYDLACTAQDIADIYGSGTGDWGTFAGAGPTSLAATFIPAD